jgi:two-component system NarL family response regulator
MAGRDSLTARDVDILTLAAAGHSEREISVTLSLSTHTIHTHFRNIFKKMRAKNRVHAVAKALTSQTIFFNE